jgi:peptide/nickel transport system permease protein
LQAIPTVLGILALNFLLIEFAPGDAADFLAAESAAASDESMQAIREQFGIGVSGIDRFVTYLSNIAHFNLGMSPRFNVPVSDLILSRLPITFALLLSALALAIVMGIVLGTIMAMNQGNIIDRILSVGSLLFYSVPGFWISLMLIVYFSIHLGILPSGGIMTIGADLHGFAWLADRAKYLVLPTVSLALFYVAIYSRVMRAAVLEVKSLDFVRTAQAKGLSPYVISVRHILRNALIPVTTLAGLHIGGIFGGAIITETVFGIPGLGRLAFDSVLARDFNVLLGLLFLSSLLVIAANLLVDVIQAWLDPRIEA